MKNKFKIILSYNFSNICNNSCIFCFCHNKEIMRRQKLKVISSFTQAVKIFNQNKDKIYKVIISGHEPTFNKDLIPFIQYIKKDNKIVELRTNGRNLKDKEFLNKVIKAGTDEVTVTLLSYKKEIHNNLTQHKESWQETIKGIKNLLAYKNKINFGIVIVVTKYNLPTLFGTVDFLAKLGLKRLQFNLLDFDKEYLVCQFDKSEKKLLNRAINRIIGTRIAFAVYGFPYCFIYKRFWQFILEARIHNEICVGTKDKDFNYIRTVQGKGKLTICKKCSKYKECEGIWKSYLKLYGGYYLNPLP